MKNGTRSYEVNQNNELLLDLKSLLKERTFKNTVYKIFLTNRFFTSFLRRSKTVFKLLAVAHIVNKLKDDFVTAFNGEEALEEASRRERNLKDQARGTCEEATCPEASSEDL